MVDRREKKRSQSTLSLSTVDTIFLLMKALLETSKTPRSYVEMGGSQSSVCTMTVVL